jgi:hypothetical protein
VIREITNDVNLGTNDNGDDVGAVATLGTLTVNFPPVTKASAGLVADLDGLTRNAARLVVRQIVTEDQTIPVTHTECSDEDPNDCGQVPTLDENGDPVTTTKSVKTEVFRKIKDGGLDGAGAGSVSINVPAGVGYVLELLTYRTGAYAPDLRVNLLNEYGKSAPFDIAVGQSTVVNITLAAIFANLDYPAEVSGGGSYTVSTSDKSSVLINTWRVMQSQTPTAENTTTSWLIATGSDSDVVVGSGPIPLTAPEYVGGVDNLLWHYGEFFINSNMLQNSEVSFNWVFGASSYNTLHPQGTITVNLN